VRELGAAPHNLVFVRTILDLARNLDLKTVAECVESEDVAEILAREGVDYMQGFAFGRPSLEYPWDAAMPAPRRAASAG
jgi:EAL domain-containing protein (putative c-di-GMP-specific phosphodiesterase class I)